jgi:integrase
MAAMGARKGVPHASPWTGHVDRGVDKRTGQVYFRGRAMVRGKRYAVIVCVPKPRPDGNGRGRVRSEKSYQDECWRRLREQIRAAARGDAVDTAKDRLFSTEINAWLEGREHNLGDRSLENYRSVATRHLIPALGHLKLSEITREAINRMLAAKARPQTMRSPDGAERQRPGLSKARLSLMHTVLHACLAQARSDGRPVQQSALDARGPSVDKKRRFAASPEQVRALFDHLERAGDRLWALWVVGFYTGCRLGELLGLRLENVDLGKRVVLIVEAMHPRPTDERTWRPTKTQHMVEKPLAGEAVRVLRLHLLRREREKAAAGDRWAEKGLVFCNEDGTPLTQARARSQFRIALKGLGWAYFPPKQLRHSFGTNLRRAGVGLDTTSRLVGHRRVSTTADVYIQPVTELELAAVDELERLVGGAERVE